MLNIRLVWRKWGSALITCGICVCVRVCTRVCVCFLSNVQGKYSWAHYTLKDTHMSHPSSEQWSHIDSEFPDTFISPSKWPQATDASLYSGRWDLTSHTLTVISYIFIKTKNSRESVAALSFSETKFIFILCITGIWLILHCKWESIYTYL